MIYLASPYSHEQAAVRDLRWRLACHCASVLMGRGEHVICPIAGSHPIAEFGLPKDWEFWADYDRALISVCDTVDVLLLDGWRTSKGVQAEMEIAKSLGKPVRFRDAQNYELLDGLVVDEGQPVMALF